GPAPAQQTPLPAPSPLVTRVYPVADLVVPLSAFSGGDVRDLARLVEFDKIAKQAPKTPPKAGTPEQTAATFTPGAAGRTLEDALMKLLVNTVEPESWSTRGGAATMEF